MPSLVNALARHAWVHRLVSWLRIYPAANRVLRLRPLERRADGGRVVYRITSLDQLSIAAGMFDRDEYGAAVGDGPVRTFIDLGCNSGLFTVWLSTRKPDPHRIGLLVDANPAMVAEARWHLERNGIRSCAVIQGAVGMARDQRSTTFNLHPSSSASSVLEYRKASQVPVKGKVVQVTVPAVVVESEWIREFGDRPVDLLKVDVEGKELDLVTYEADFLHRRVRRIVIEWHKWAVPFDELDGRLSKNQFAQRGAYEETDFAKLVVYENQAQIA